MLSGRRVRPAALLARRSGPVPASAGVAQAAPAAQCACARRRAGSALPRCRSWPRPAAPVPQPQSPGLPAQGANQGPKTWGARQPCAARAAGTAEASLGAERRASVRALADALAARPVWAPALLAARVPAGAAADAEMHKRVAYMFRNGARPALGAGAGLHVGLRGPWRGRRRADGWEARCACSARACCVRWHAPKPGTGIARSLLWRGSARRRGGAVGAGARAARAPRTQRVHGAAGPWKGCWVRCGFDPRLDPAARRLQVLELRVPAEWCAP